MRMPNLYADRHLKNLVQRRRDALSNPEGGDIISEAEALVAMLEEDYQREYQRMKGEQAT